MQDEVDRLVAAWARERPDLDVRPLEVLSRVTRLARHLDRARRTAFAAHDLEVWEFDVLSALRRAGRAVRALPRAAARPDHGHLGHHDQPGRPAGGARAWCSGCPTPPTAAACTSASPRAGKERVDGALADLLARERELLSALPAQQQETLSAPAAPAGRPVRGRPT